MKYRLKGPRTVTVVTAEAYVVAAVLTTDVVVEGDNDRQLQAEDRMALAVYVERQDGFVALDFAVVFAVVARFAFAVATVGSAQPVNGTVTTTVLEAVTLVTVVVVFVLSSSQLTLARICCGRLPLHSDHRDGCWGKNQRDCSQWAMLTEVVHR